MQIERKRGDTYADEFIVTDKRTWEPANLSGCSCSMSLDTRAAPGDSTTQVYRLTGVVKPLEGVVEFAPTATQADLVGTFYFDVQLTDATGKIRTITSGTYIYTQDRTK